MNGELNNVELRWLEVDKKIDHPSNTEESYFCVKEKVLQYRVQAGGSYRDWTEWTEVPVVSERGKINNV
jgi:hypothetical protein